MSFNRIRNSGGGDGCIGSRPTHTSSKDWYPRVSDLPPEHRRRPRLSDERPPLHSSFRTVSPVFHKRVCSNPTALGLLLRVLPRSVRLERGGLHPEPGCGVGLSVLLRQHRRRVALSHVQHPICASVAGRGHLLRVYRVQRESMRFFRLTRAFWRRCVVLTTRRTDLCRVCVHVYLPYPVIWEEQSRCQAGHDTHAGCLQDAK